ncbi:MAG: leucine-rich repeat domain-containing protein [Ruminococcus sp.]|nr:leucine-rich repeat domain-containing protein [Ruminococcus sp.]
MTGAFEIKDNVLIKYHGKENYIMIPDGVTRIGEYAFCDRKNLCMGIMQIKGVYIPEGVVSIGHSAFRNCWNLERVSLPESLVRIESFAFAQTGLKEIILPDGIRQFQGDTFQGCYHLEKVSYHGVTFSHRELWMNANYRMAVIIKSLRTDKVPAMEMLLKTGQEQAVIQSYEKFISRKNIDRLIRVAIEQKAHELQLILTDYKYQHFKFQNPADKLKL